jgi:type I restriction enzyme S subunit
MRVRDGYKMTEWGEIPQEWEVKILDEAACFKNGKPHENCISDDGKYLVINSKFISTNGQIFKYSTQNLSPLSKGDIAFVMSDIPNGKALAKCYLVSENNKFALNQRICSLRAININNKYLYYVLNRNKYFLSYDDGVNQTNLKKDEVLNCPVLLPLLQEQQSIADVLSANDDLITKNSELIEKTKEIKQGLMRELLTRGIGHTEFKDSELGRIPKEWEIRNLEDIVLKITDGAHQTPKYMEDGIPFLRVTDIHATEIDWSNVKYISKEEHNDLLKRCKPEKGDILYSKNGTIGIPKIIDWDNEFSIFVSLCLIKINKKDSKVINKYLEKFLASDKCLDQIRLRAKQGTVTNLHLEEIRKLLIPVPSREEQQRIADILSLVDNRIESLEKRKQHIEEIRKGLMQDLLTGRVRVNLDAL